MGGGATVVVVGSAVLRKTRLVNSGKTDEVVAAVMFGGAIVFIR